MNDATMTRWTSLRFDSRRRLEAMRRPPLAAFRSRSTSGRAATWRSTIAGQRARTIDCLHWRPIWFAAQVTVIVATWHPAALAAKAATSIIAIVFHTAADPVEAGLVASLNRLGGNHHGRELVERGARAEAARALARAGPQGDRRRPARQPDQSHSAEESSRDLQAAARTLGLQLHVLHASTERDFDTVICNLGPAASRRARDRHRCILQAALRDARCTRRPLDRAGRIVPS